MAAGLSALLRRNQNFIRNVATLLTGRGAATAITILLTPVISRLFTPEDFGVMALLLSVTIMLAALSTLRFERAVVLPRDDSEAIELVQLASWVAIAVSILLLVITTAAWLSGLPLPLSDGLGGWMVVIAPVVAINGLAVALEGWLVRKKAFRAIALAEVGMTSTTAATRIGAGFLAGSSVWGLVGGFVAGRLVFFFTLWGCRQARLPLPGKRPPTPRLRELVHEYRDFPIYNAPTGFVKSIAQNLPVIMLGLMFSPAIVGFYAMANRLVRAPLELAASSVRRVYLQRLAEIHNNGLPLRGAYVKTTLVLAILGLPPCALLWFGGEWLLTWFLGEQWVVAGRYVALLVPWLYAIWLSVAVNSLVVVLRRQGLWLWRQVLIALAQLASFLVAWQLNADPEWTVRVFALVAMVANLSTVALGYYLASTYIPPRAGKRGGEVPPVTTDDQE